METQKVYKALMEVDGRLESVIAGLGDFTDYKMLTYKEGEITYAPEGSMGVFVFNSLDRAQSLLRGNLSYTDRGARTVYEVVPLGSRMTNTSSTAFGFELRYPAILLGKEVWRDEPKEEWVDVTMECNVFILPNAGTPLRYIIVAHNNRWVLRIGNKVIIDVELPDTYKVELLEDTKYHYDCGGFKILKKVMK